jgi:hypothetical protein
LLKSAASSMVVLYCCVHRGQVVHHPAISDGLPVASMVATSAIIKRNRESGLFRSKGSDYGRIRGRRPFMSQTSSKDWTRQSRDSLLIFSIAYIDLCVVIKSLQLQTTQGRDVPRAINHRPQIGRWTKKYRLLTDVIRPRPLRRK